MKLALFSILLTVLFSQSSFANITSYGLQCSSLEAADIKNCLKKEAGKIDEANLPNEIIISSDNSGKTSLLKLINEITAKKNNDYTQKLLAMIPLIESSVATALIIQYEDEPQLYYYVVDRNGKLEVVFDGINSVDISETYEAIFKNEPDVFYLKSANVSKTFLEWLDFLKED